MHELDTSRKEGYAVSERRIGIEREFWFLQNAPQGDLYVAYMESQDFGHALETFCASSDPFDRWFKEQLLDVTGLDLNIMPAGPLSELVSSYESNPIGAAR